MTATLLALGLALTVPDGDSGTDKPRKPHPFAPSLEQLSDEEEKKLDEIIDGFIKYDTGQLRFRSASELLEASGKERGQRLKAVLLELSQRPGDEPIAALGVAAASYDKSVQLYARNLLAQNLTRQKPDTIKEKLKDEKAEV